ncbi:MAG: GIY-YIG nuclease family protein [Candidatus Heimdallarchaeota archaeon]
MYFVYLLKCGSSGKKPLYCGYTKNIKRRLEDHQTGRGGRFTRSRQPVELVYWEEHSTRKKAIRREREVKKFSRREKLRMIRFFSENQVASEKEDIEK